MLRMRRSPWVCAATLPLKPFETYNSVDNLPKKFGGKYDTPKKGVIVINGEQF